MGETIFKGHRSYDLMLNLQLGIRWSINKVNAEVRSMLGGCQCGAAGQQRCAACTACNKACCGGCLGSGAWCGSCCASVEQRSSIIAAPLRSMLRLPWRRCLRGAADVRLAAAEMAADAVVTWPSALPCRACSRCPRSCLRRTLSTCTSRTSLGRAATRHQCTPPRTLCGRTTARGRSGARS
jgi:hypothetical protein